MNQSQRKLSGTVGLLLLTLAWAFGGTALYLLLPAGLPGIVLIGFFCIVGLGWFFPASVLIRWMSKPDPV